MRLPPAFHLPGIPVGSVPALQKIGDTPLEVPRLDAAGVERVWRRLEVAAAVWRGRDLDARIEIAGSLMQELGARGPGPWREALARSAGLSPVGTDAAWETTFAVHGADGLREALRLERLDAAQLATLELAGRVPHRLVHVLSGNVLPPTVALLLRGWLLGAAQWVRPASREPVFAACLLADLVESAPELAACTAVCWWPHMGSALGDAVLRAAQVVTVNGSDTAVDALCTRLQQVTSPAAFVGYGSRWSAALVSAAAETQRTAHALAWDVALFDQQGCLSPSLVFAERSPHLGAWCAELAAELAWWEKRMPRGAAGGTANAALRHWHETARLARTLGVLEGFWEPERSAAWGVACCARTEVYDTPLDRHIVVVPFEKLDEIEPALGKRLEQLQGLVLELDGWPQAERDAALARLRPTRVSPAGSLQRARLDWRQDHRAPFGSLLLS